MNNPRDNVVTHPSWSSSPQKQQTASTAVETDVPNQKAGAAESTSIPTFRTEGSTDHAENEIIEDEEKFPMNRSQFLQLLLTLALTIVGTVIAIVALVVPLMSGRTDAQYESLRTEMKAVSEKLDGMDKNWRDHQEMYERVIDERTKSK